MNRVTEQESIYAHIDRMTIAEIVRSINEEDRKVAVAIEKQLPQITRLIEAIEERMQQGGRLFYIGAGTSGRIGVLDASEIYPTFGVQDLIIGIIAGGDQAIRFPVEQAEDDKEQGWKDLCAYDPRPTDTVLGITASGMTPYAIGACKMAKQKGLLTASLSMNEGSLLAKEVDFPLEVVVGPEFITGSTRMKSGTAQKMILNMISTTLMIKMGKVSGNKMSHMQLSNRKLVERGVDFLCSKFGISAEIALAEITKHQNLHDAVSALQKKQASL